MHSNRQFRNTSTKLSEATIDPAVIQNMFEHQFHYELFISRCQDTGEKPDGEKAKMFKESFNKINSKKTPNILNLYSMRLGVNTIMKLSSILTTHKFKHVNLADNSISEYGMHAVKNLLSSCDIESLNIASNMISEVGLSLVMDELIRNTTLKVLDISILEGSIRKNSIGIDGARCLAAVLLQNRTLESLKLEDNDIGINGAEIISIPLKKNKVLKNLKISENMIKTQGAEYIFQNAINIENLDLGKNFIKSSIGPALEKYFIANKNLKKISLELNELLPEGAKILFEGVLNSSVSEVNVRGNSIGDRGINLIANVFLDGGRIHQSLKILDISNNEITEQSVPGLITILDHLELTSLNLSKNHISDAGIIQLISKFKQVSTACTLEKLDLSGCKMSDKSFLVLLEVLNSLPELKYVRCLDNYISERYEKMYIDILSQNKTLINLNLHGNRISLSGVKAIKKIIDRNMKQFQEREPNRMKSEIYNMKEKQRKVKQAQEKLEKQKNDIQRLEEVKARLTENLQKMEREQRQKKNDFEESIRIKMEEIDGLAKSNNEKIEDLENMKRQKQQNLQQLNASLEKLRERRKQLEYQLNIIKNEGELIEQQFQRKARMID